MSVADELQKLLALKNSGDLTDTEFQSAKQALISSATQNQVKQSEESKKSDAKNTGGGFGIVVKVVGFALAIIVGLIIIGSISDRPAYSGGMSEADARELCETMIKTMANNQSSVKIDRVRLERIGETASLKWRHGEIQTPNAFGAAIDRSGSCIINLKTKKLEEFEVR